MERNIIWEKLQVPPIAKRPIRVFTAGLSTEVSTFASWPADLRGFETGGLFPGSTDSAGESANRLVLGMELDPPCLSQTLSGIAAIHMSVLGGIP